MGWFENDKLFKRELETGHRWAQVVTDALVERGIDASLTPMEWRKSIDDRHRFSDEKDIIVNCPRGQFNIEVKSRKNRFTDNPAEFPYSSAFVDTKEGWDKKSPTPLAVVMVSQVTGGMVVVPVRTTMKNWTTKTTRDRVRDITVTVYECDRNSLVSFEVLVKWLLSEPATTT